MSDHINTITNRMTFNQVQKLVDERYAAGAMAMHMKTWEIELYGGIQSIFEDEFEAETNDKEIYGSRFSHEEITGLIQEMIHDYIDAERKADVWWTVFIAFSDGTMIHTPVYAKWRRGDRSIGEPGIVRLSDER